MAPTSPDPFGPDPAPPLLLPPLGSKSDPVMDFLTGKTSVYEPAPRTEQILDELKQEDDARQLLKIRDSQT